MAAAASAPAGLGYGEADRFQGGAYCACAGSLPGCGEGGGDVPGAWGPGCEVLEVRGRDGSKDEKWRQRVARGRSREVRKGRGRVDGWEV